METAYENVPMRVRVSLFKHLIVENHVSFRKGTAVLYLDRIVCEF